MTRASSLSIATTTTMMPSFESALRSRKDGFADIADARAVDEHVAAVRFADLVAELGRKLSTSPFSTTNTLSRLDAGLHGEAAVLQRACDTRRGPARRIPGARS